MLAIEQCATGFASFSLTQEKVCNTCGETKRLSEFRRRGKHTEARKTICIVCSRAKSLAYYKLNPDRNRAEKDGIQHYGVDEKYGDTWQGLDAALSMCRRTTPLQRAA